VYDAPSPSKNVSTDSEADAECERSPVVMYGFDDHASPTGS
jgi:hypothetical protein